MTENRTYTEADLKALKKEWEQEHVQSALVTKVAAIEAQLSTMPALMEATARRVISEVQLAQAQQNAEQRAQRSEQRSEHAWDRAPVVMQALQMLVWLAVAAGAYVAGKGHLP